MKKQNFLLFLLCSSINLSTFCAEIPQSSYWQRFKNWLSGGPSYARSMVEVPYDWAREFVLGLTQSQQMALLAVLEVIILDSIKKGTINIKESLPISLEIAGITSLIAPYIFKYANAVNLKYTIFNIKKDLEKFPTTQSKINMLIALQNSFSSTEDKGNAIALQAINTILDELSK